MTNPHFYWDKWKMLLVTGDPKSWRDAIGRLMEYLYAHGKFHEKNEALEQCLELINGKYILLRHPAFALKQVAHDHLPDQSIYKYDKKGDDLASRDHWSYFIQYKKNTLSKEDFADFISKVPRMRGMTLWMKTMKGSKWGEWWFYTIFNPGAYLGNIVSNLITWIGRLGPEESIHWWIEHKKDSTISTEDLNFKIGGNTILEADDISNALGAELIGTLNKGTAMLWNLTRWQKFWRKWWVIITPFYPIQNRAWQLKWLPPSKRKERQKRILLRRTDRGNLIVRALFGDTHISELELQKYPETTGDASGVKLNKSCDRTVEKIHNVKNCYKKKLGWKLHNENIKS